MCASQYQKRVEIYLVTNLINGKRYVGKTKFTKEDRWKSHCQAAGNEKYRKVMYLFRAMAKHGLQNFRVETLAPVDREELLNPLERHFIALYKTQSPKFGYNGTAGGDGGAVLSEDGRRRCAEAARRRPITELREREARFEKARQARGREADSGRLRRWVGSGRSRRFGGLRLLLPNPPLRVFQS